jgi:hypothetical protein
MAERLKAEGEIPIIAKLVVCVTPPVVASQIFHVSYFLTGLACVGGVLLQALIPPRKKGLWAGLLISAGVTLVALLWRK